MSNFFGNLISRHLQPQDNIRPRLPGLFEPDRISSGFFSGENPLHGQESPVTGDEQQFPHPDQPKADHFTLEKTAETSESRNSSSGIEKSKNSISARRISNENPEKKAPEPHLKNPSKIIEDTKKEDRITRERKVSPKFPEEILPKTSRTNDFSGKPSLQKGKINQRENYVAVEPLPGKKKPDLPEIIPVKNTSQPLKQNFSLPENFSRWMETPAKNPLTKTPVTASPPPIQINIGRIEVKAIQEPGPVSVQNKPVYKPRLTLEDFLQQKNGGKK